MNTVLLGNIVALIGAAIMVSTGFLKTKKQILTVQCFQFVVLSASNAILGAFTGITANVIGIARNLFCMKKEFTTPWKIVFIAAQLALLFAFNSDGWLRAAARGGHLCVHMVSRSQGRGAAQNRHSSSRCSAGRSTTSFSKTM